MGLKRFDDMSEKLKSITDLEILSLKIEAAGIELPPNCKIIVESSELVNQSISNMSTAHAAIHSSQHTTFEYCFHRGIRFIVKNNKL